LSPLAENSNGGEAPRVSRHSAGNCTNGDDSGDRVAA
jgi:hypothetical protein